MLGLPSFKIAVILPDPLSVVLMDLFIAVVSHSYQCGYQHWHYNQKVTL